MKKAYFAALIAVLLPSQALAFSCVRHIYNNSTCQWQFQAQPGINTNVYLNSQLCRKGRKQVKVPVSCNNVANGPCPVKPHCTISMEFTYNGGRVNGKMLIKDAHSTEKKFDYDTDNKFNECPYIHHSGNTGGASVNDPANGDITIHNCSW